MCTGCAWERVPYLSALGMWSRQRAIQIQICTVDEVENVYSPSDKIITDTMEKFYQNRPSFKKDMTKHKSCSLLMAHNTEQKHTAWQVPAQKAHSNNKVSRISYLGASAAECPGAGVDATKVVAVENPHLLIDLDETRHDLRLAGSRQVQAVQLLREYLSNCTVHHNVRLSWHYSANAITERML